MLIGISGSVEYLSRESLDMLCEIDMENQYCMLGFKEKKYFIHLKKIVVLVVSLSR